VLDAWVHVLAARAMGLPACVRVLGTGGETVYLQAPPDPAGARGHLERLVEVWRAGRGQPLPLFENASWNLAVELFKTSHGDETGARARFAPERLVGTVAAGLDGGPYLPPGDRTEAHVAALFSDLDPLEALREEGPLSLRDLALDVWFPALRAMAEDQTLKSAWEDR
jgi:hypothetical protein